VLLGCFAFIQLFLLGVIVPSEKALLDCAANQPPCLLLHQILLILEVVFCQFRVLLLPLLPHLLKYLLFLRLFSSLLSLLYQLVHSRRLTFPKLLLSIDVESQFLPVLRL
jgi:hypothetical protein